MKLNRRVLRVAAKRVKGIDDELKFLGDVRSYLTLPYGKGITESQVKRFQEIQSVLMEARAKLFLTFAEDVLTLS